MVAQNAVALRAVDGIAMPIDPPAGAHERVVVAENAASAVEERSARRRASSAAPGKCFQDGFRSGLPPTRIIGKAVSLVQKNAVARTRRPSASPLVERGLRLEHALDADIRRDLSRFRSQPAGRVDEMFRSVVVRTRSPLRHHTSAGPISRRFSGGASRRHAHLVSQTMPQAQQRNDPHDAVISRAKMQEFNQ